MDFEPVFAIGWESTLFGLGIALVDYILFAIKRPTFLKLRYQGKVLKDLLLDVLWALGAGIVGAIVAAAGVLRVDPNQIQLPPALFIAICWPLIITQFVDKVANKQDGASQPAPEAKPEERK